MGHVPKSESLSSRNDKKKLGVVIKERNSGEDQRAPMTKSGWLHVQTPAGSYEVMQKQLETVQ